MRTLDRFFEIELLTYSDINKSSSISVPRFEMKDAFTTGLQCREVNEVRFSPPRIYEY